MRYILNTSVEGRRKIEQIANIDVEKSAISGNFHLEKVNITLEKAIRRGRGRWRGDLELRQGSLRGGFQHRVAALSRQALSELESDSRLRSVSHS